VDDLIQDVEPAKREAAAAAVEDFLRRFIDGEVKPQDAAKSAAVDDMLRTVWDKFQQGDRPDKFEKALGAAWGAVARVDAPRGIDGPVDRVGVKDIFERYFFVADPTRAPRTPGRLTGFSPEVTLLLRGVLYDPDEGEPAPRNWPRERWIVLRDLAPEPGRPAGAPGVVIGRLWGALAPDGTFTATGGAGR
jgi:hypothetical protein